MTFVMRIVYLGGIVADIEWKFFNCIIIMMEFYVEWLLNCIILLSCQILLVSCLATYIDQTWLYDYLLLIYLQVKLRLETYYQNVESLLSTYDNVIVKVCTNHLWSRSFLKAYILFCLMLSMSHIVTLSRLFSYRDWLQN